MFYLLLVIISSDGVRIGTGINIDATGTISVNAIDYSQFEKVTNKVTVLSADSTDIQYPSAKCVYDIIGNLEQVLTQLDSGGGV